MSRGLVYTCIVCRRDDLATSSPQTGFDYVCHTDEPDRNTGRGWRTEPLHFRHRQAILTARWHKMHPHRHSPGYDWYVWLDGHIAPGCDLRELTAEMGTAEVAAFRHRTRRDPYAEARFLLDRGLVPAPACNQAIQLLQAMRYPDNGGLHETGILLMRNTPRLRKVLEEWWKCLEASGCSRDQLHFDRIVRARGLELHELEGEPRTSTCFDWNSHGRPSQETHRLRELWDPSPVDGRD